MFASWRPRTATWPAWSARATFREDLWYRIAVFPILLPPLRDRLEDIPALGTPLRRAGRDSLRPGAGRCRATPTFELLQTYDWPGNIRELGAVIDRAAILGNGDSLELAAALGVAAPRGPALESSARTDTWRPSSVIAASKIASLNDAMRSHIEAALRATHGRVEGPRGAARLLAINPHTLRARMRKLKIDWAAFREPTTLSERDDTEDSATHDAAMALAPTAAC